jgi:hypothetical protein
MKLFQSFESIAIDDKNLVEEIHELKTKHEFEIISLDEKKRLDFLLEDPEIEKGRVAAMSEKIFAKSRELPENSVIYVYPIGNMHVSAVAQKLRERGSDIQIFENRLWENNSDRELLKEEVSSGLDFFLCSAMSKYDERIKEIFPDLEFVSLSTSNVTESSTKNSEQLVCKKVMTDIVINHQMNGK